MSTNAMTDTSVATSEQIHILFWEEQYGDEGSKKTFVEAFVDKAEADKEARMRKPPAGFTGKSGDFDVVSIPLSRSSLQFMANMPVRA